MSVDLLVSVIIPAYRRPALLRSAIRSVLAQDLDPHQFEVIVVDSSPDGANVEVVGALQNETRFPLRYFTKRPEGPGPARNLGVSHARGRFLAFMDSDCEASPQWLRKGVAAFQDGVGLVQGRTIPEQGVAHSVFNYAVQVEREHFLYETANIFYYRPAFEQGGGFWTDLIPHADKPIGGEDVDLAWRVKRNGWKSQFEGDALVTHAVVRLTVWRWLLNRHLYILPRLLRDHPELRGFFFRRYFFDHVQALLVLGLVGLALGALFWPALLLAIPYAVTRVSEPSRSLHGPLRFLRVLIYLPRDLGSLCILLAGSIRYRALLL
jgi:glycosyltransferase involved in cell wall biosynthesis